MELVDKAKRIGSKKRVYGCDTFEGFPYDDKHTLNGKKGASKGLDYEEAIKKIKDYNSQDQVTLLKGMFEETLYQKLGNKRFSVVFVDCNLYESTKYALEFSYPRLSEGGVIIFDEYEDKKKGKPDHGETVAANEFCVKNGIRFNLTPIPHIKKDMV